MSYLNGKKIALNPKFLGIANLKPLYDVLGLEPTIEGESVTIEELTNLVEGINSLGVANLKKKLSEVYDDLTTVEIMSLIDSITEIPSNLDHTVKFMVDGEPYEVVSVKDGNSVNSPSGTPTSENGEFGKWSLNGSDVTFPYTPTEDSEFIAMFELVSQKLYERFGVDRNTYPYIVIKEFPYTLTSRAVRIYFFKEIIFDTTSNEYKALNGHLELESGNVTVAGDDVMTIGEILNHFINDTSIKVQYIRPQDYFSGYHSITVSGNDTVYTNSDLLVEGYPDNSSYFE
jgi:hypothetical protein